MAKFGLDSGLLYLIFKHFVHGITHSTHDHVRPPLVISQPPPTPQYSHSSNILITLMLEYLFTCQYQSTSQSLLPTLKFIKLQTIISGGWVMVQLDMINIGMCLISSFTCKFHLVLIFCRSFSSTQATLCPSCMPSWCIV